MHEHESKRRLADYRPKDVARMSQRLVNTSLADFQGRDVAVARVQQNDPQNLLVEKLHIRAPIFHRIQPRVQAHILIAFLGYCLWVCLKQKLRAGPEV